jgi:hypothetical protein
MIQFGPNIAIDGSKRGARPGPWARNYEVEVQRQLTLLLMFEAGRIVINAIWARGGQKLRVIPYTRLDHNAAASWLNNQGAFAAGLRARDGATGAVIPGGGTGQGTGSDSDLAYTPSMFGEDRGGWNRNTRLESWVRMHQSAPLPGDERGEQLLHELTHSMQQMSGRLTNAPMSGYLRMDTASEVVAIVVANIYASERGRSLRANHNGYDVLADQRRFASNVELRRQLLDFRSRMPAVAAQLARVNTAFNPFRTLAAVA